jgi:hypothetical protein
MRFFHQVLERARNRLLPLFGRAEDQSRRILLIALGVACLLAVSCSALVFLSLRDPAASVNLVKTTATTTLAATTASPAIMPTVTPQKTKTTTGGKTVSSKPVSVPHPPPPPPPPPPTPTATPCAAPTAAPAPTATPVASASPSAAAATSGAQTGVALLATHLSSPCTPCGQNAGNNPSQSQIRAALDAAADRYGLPRNLVYGFAWQESRWHQDVDACDGGVGLMQIQYYYEDYFNHSSVLNGSGCGVSDSSYDIQTLSGNAYLGAKVIKYLSCYYKRIASDKYQTAGLGYPDTASAPSLCAQLYDSNTNGPTTTLYQDLPSSVAEGWSCPLDPTQGITSAEVLDYSVSAYNAGQTAIYNCGCIPNLGYVGAVEYWTTQFRQGILP